MSGKAFGTCGKWKARFVENHIDRKRSSWVLYDADALVHEFSVEYLTDGKVSELSDSISTIWFGSLLIQSIKNGTFDRDDLLKKVRMRKALI